MADTFRLRYGESAKPVLADRDGEVDTNWADNGNHSLTASATHAYTGTKSFKIVATNTGDFTTNYVSLASGNNATFVVGKQYVVTLWGYAEAPLTFKIKTGGVESSTFSLDSGTWKSFNFTFTDVTATTALQIAVVEAGTEPYAMWFELEPFAEYVELTVLAERGMAKPDSVELFGGPQNRYLDGTMEDQIKAFRRKIWVDCEVVTSTADMKRILYWVIDNARAVDYLTEVNVPLCLSDTEGFENTWDFDCSLMPHYSFNLLEPSVRTTFPV
jgi:hypothetical protein